MAHSSYGDFISGASLGKAKLVAQKSKGMPVISIPLTKLADSSAREVMSNLPLRLFNAFKSIKNSLKEGNNLTILHSKILDVDLVLFLN